MNTYQKRMAEKEAAKLMIEATKELDRASDEIIQLRQLLRETAIRCQIAFPENEEEDKWWNEQCHHKKSGDFKDRLFSALKK